MQLLVPGDAGGSRASGCLSGDATATELALPHAILVRGQFRDQARELLAHRRPPCGCGAAVVPLEVLRQGLLCNSWVFGGKPKRAINGSVQILPEPTGIFGAGQFCGEAWPHTPVPVPQARLRLARQRRPPLEQAHLSTW